MDRGRVITVRRVAFSGVQKQFLPGSYSCLRFDRSFSTEFRCLAFDGIQARPRDPADRKSNGEQVADLFLSLHKPVDVAMPCVGHYVVRYIPAR